MESNNRSRKRRGSSWRQDTWRSVYLALGLLGAALAAVAGLTAAFGKLQAQGFAIAKLSARR